MELILNCPLRATTLTWEGQRGEVMLTVVVKATFELEPEVSRLASAQDDLNDEPNYWNDDPNRSVYSPSDLAPFKPRGDVVLVGHAFAPRGEPVRSLLARMIIGEVDKSIEVHADRAFSQDGLMREGTRFVKMPLRYERAAGGSESWNPVGVAQDGRRDQYGNQPLPNLQPPGLLVSDPGDFIEPIGFGPIAPRWPHRRDKLGPHADRFLESSYNDAPIPPEVDFGFFCCAPRDQQVEALRDNERIILENLHPKHARLVTSLPGVRPSATLERASGSEEIKLRCDTLWIDTDRGQATLVWRGQARLAQHAEAGRVRIDMTGADASMIAEPPPSAKTHNELAVEIESEETHTGNDRVRAALPFQQKASSGTMAIPASAVPSTPRPETPPAIGRRPRASTLLDSQARALANEAATRAVDASPAWLQQTRAPGVTSQPPPPPPRMQAPAPPPPVGRNPETAPIAPAPSLSPWAGGGPLGANTPPPAPAWSPTPPPSNVAAPAFAPREASPIAAPSRSAAPPPAPPIVGSNVAQAATIGAVAASDAAAAAARAAAIKPDAPIASDDRPAPRASFVADPVELLWFNPKSVARLRAVFRDVLTALEFEDDDPKHDFRSDDPDADRDRRAVFGILTDVRAEDASGVARAVANAVSSKGRFTAPLVVVSGDLRFPFDDVESLKAVVGAITPVIGGDKKLKEQVDAVSELLKTPYLQGSNGMVQKIEQQLQDQLAQTNKSLPNNYLELNVERMMLEQRHYQKRKVFGEPWLRALCNAGASDNLLPTYLPEACADTLPMSVTMRARIIAEVVPQQDQYETHPYALKVHALGRVLRLARS